MLGDFAMKIAKKVLIETAMWRDPAILPHHDGVIARNVASRLDGGKVTPSSILKRSGWTPARIAYYLGYPDEVFYDPTALGQPVTLYALNRVWAAEQVFVGQARSLEVCARVSLAGDTPFVM